MYFYVIIRTEEGELVASRWMCVWRLLHCCRRCPVLWKMCTPCGIVFTVRLRLLSGTSRKFSLSAGCFSLMD